MTAISFSVNGTKRTVDVHDPDKPLLYILRNEIGLKGPKFGCGLGQCGACSVLINGEAVRSCLIPASALNGKAITTIEGLGTPEKPHKVQAAFIAVQAAQCGYCTNGMVMTSAALLARNQTPTEAQVKEELANNICRCGTHDRIVSAVMQASGRTRG